MGVITWCWAAILTLIAVCFCSCSYAEDAPDWAVRIMNETHKRVIVEHQNWYARDFRYVPAGEEVWGNCATFATTAVILGMQDNRHGYVASCGNRHVVAIIDGWILDARNREPVPNGPLSCE